MPVVSGILKVGEAQGAVRAIGRHQMGSQNVYVFLLIGLMAAGAVLGETIAPRLGLASGGIGVWIGLFVAALIYTLFGRKFVVWRFRKRLADRAIPMDMPLIMEITADALSYKVGDVEQKAKWGVVTEIFRSYGYWIFMVQASAWFAPEHFFANSDEEKLFLKAALRYMSDGARTRSSDATAFTEAGQ